MIRENYRSQMFHIMKTLYPYLSDIEIENAISYSINKRYKKIDTKVYNNYTNEIVEKTLEDLTNWILEKKPITTAYGVMFEKLGLSPNPLIELIESYMVNRDKNKAKMFTYPKGSTEFERYNLAQLLNKRDANSIYGCLGNAASALYNLHVAASIPAQGRSIISSATMFFEGFLSNNVKFGSLEEIVHYITNICSEPRHYDDSTLLDRQISVEECLAKIILTCGDWRKGKIKWIPDFTDIDIIYNILLSCTPTDINRIYYKNNLYEFLNNKSMTNALIYILKALQTPYMACNEVPDEIKVELDSLQDILGEYVFYNYLYIDKIDRCDNMIKNVCVISDTDSTIVTFDAFYHFVLDKIDKIPMKIKELDEDDKQLHPFMIFDMKESYDFLNDDIVYKVPDLKLCQIIPNNKLRYSILNIIAYISGNLCNEYIKMYTKQTHSWVDGNKCLLYLKNEFTFYRALLTSGKKNYATIQEVQEGHIIPQNIKTALDIKGLPINKSTINASAKSEMKKILYENILKPDEVKPVEVIEKLAILEKKIYKSLQSGSKEYYKPLAIKAMSNYAAPLSEQGIKASLIWNKVRDDELEAIDLDSRNTIGIVYVDITPMNISKIKDTYPDTYQKFVNLYKDSSIFAKGSSAPKQSDYKITSLAIPVNVKTPKWVLEFIDYGKVINANISTFPVESIGISRLGTNNINYTNIISI